jgi:hypothetical protein
MEKLDMSIRQNLVNDFADYVCEIISENNTHKTKLSVVDVESFMVVKGYTKSDNLIEFTKITSDFIENFKEKYPDLKYFNTIDVMSYGSNNDLFNDEIISFTTKEENQINSQLSISISSKFPHGYSENYLKQTYNHLKEMSCKIQPYFKFSWVELTCKLTKTDFEIISIDSDSYYSSEKLLSILKDNYDGPIDVLLDEDNMFLNVV